MRRVQGEGVQVIARMTWGDLIVGLVGGTITTLFCMFMMHCTPAPVGPTQDADASAIEGGTDNPGIVNAIDAGTEIANGACTFLEGITQNQTVISICASVEEVAALVGFVSSFLRHGQLVDAGACTAVPNTNLCATRAEIGQGISFLVAKRQAMFMLDGGAR